MVGKILHEARKKKGWSLKQVADNVSSYSSYLSVGFLSQLENERKPLIEDRVHGLSVVLNIDKGYLIEAIKQDRMLKCRWCEDCRNAVKETL